MPIKVGDRVKEFTVSTGIGGISFTGPYNGFQRFDDVLTSGDNTYYVIEENDKWEVGIGTYGSNNLERTTVLTSSNGGSKISLGGSGSVSIVYPASEAVFNDDFVYVSGKIVQTVGVSGISVSKIGDLVHISAAPVQNTANYASGQAIENQSQISSVSGWAGVYADAGDASVSGWADSTFLKSDDDTYVSGVASYASGQSIANENDIVATSGIAAYASGHTLQGVTDNGSATTNSITITNNNIVASSGLFDSLDMTPLAEADYPSHQEGVIFYDSDNHTLSLYNDESDVTLQLGQEEFLRVRNNTGATITNGTAVLITGSHGNAAPAISGAIATLESTSQVVGLATHDIEDSSFGYVTTYGIVRNVDTSHCSDGDEIFLSATQIGSGVNVSPTIPNYKVTVGHVIRSHASNGSILVQIGHPKLGGGDLKSEIELNLSGVPFVTSIADTTAGGSQTDPLFIFDSNNRQLQIGSGIQLLDGEPSNTSNVLYNDGGSLKFNGLPVGSVTSSQLDYVSGISVYGSGQSIDNENDIVSVSGVANYASGQAIANESDIVAVSGLIGTADFLPGATGTLIDQNAQDIVTASGALRTSINQNVLDISSVSGLLTPSGDSFTFSSSVLTYFNSDGGSFSVDLSSISGDVYASIVDGAPETLNTLNEIAAAIDDDQNIATTLTNLITSSSGNLQSQITSNDSDIVAVSGIAVYASGKAYDDTYLSGIAVYSSGQAIANESDIASNTSNISTNTSNISTNTSNIAINTARVNYASGQAIANESDIIAVSGIATKTFTVTAADSSNYTIDGMGLNSDTDPTIYLHKGHTYYFDKQTASHPFRVSTSNGGAAYQDADGNSIEISGQGVLKFEVPQDAPDKLYYYCTSHAAMNGVIYTTNNVDEIIHVSGIAAYASGAASSFSVEGTPSGVGFFDDAGSLSGNNTFIYDGSDVRVSGKIFASGERVITSDEIFHIRQLTQAEYDAITPDPATFYIITDAGSSSVVQSYREVSSNATILATDYTINATASLVLTLPTAVGNEGLIYNIKNTSTGNVIVSGVSSQTIDNEPSFEISTQYQSIKIQSTNSNWIIL